MNDGSKKASSSDDTNLKDIEYYSQCVNAWFTTCFEYDKSILTLSFAVLGFFITFFEGKIETTLEFCLYLTVIILLLITIGSTLFIFKENKKRLEIITTEGTEKTGFLEKLDFIATTSFCIATILILIMGISDTANSLNFMKGKS